MNITNISINESNAGYNLRFSKYIFEDFVAIAGPMFAKMGLGNVKWDIGDDGFVNPDIFVKPVLQDKAIAPYLGPIAWHSWNLDNYSDSSFNALVSVAKQYGKEIWATELGYDPLLQFNDPQQFTTFTNAMQDAEIYLRSLTVVHCTVMDYWDFADDFPLVSPSGHAYPDYYIVKSYQDNLKAGARRSSMPAPAIHRSSSSQPRIRRTTTSSRRRSMSTPAARRRSHSPACRISR